MELLTIECLGIPNNWDEIRQEVIERYDSKCFICGSRQFLTAHHIKPRSEGGSHDLRNLVCLCNNCHDNVEGESWEFILESKETKDEEKIISKIKKYNKKF
ncbi:MAG: HNH endonuclease [Ignavibacteriales bacterium]|nr:HNH endonuclease [Ignavibacteriales bacterium]